MSEQLDRLLSIMAELRDPHRGCEWDVAQTFATIAPYTIEEAYEVADAIAREDMEELRGELGDLLLQVVFHARMAEEAGHFTFDEVARTIADTMEARHPHDGFDWPDAKGPAAKVVEEIGELAEASPDKRLEEAGDLLFAAANLVRAYDLSPEEALRAANDKFERRYRAMEQIAEGRFAGLSLDEQEALWQRVKRDPEG